MMAPRGASSIDSKSEPIMAYSASIATSTPSTLIVSPTRNTPRSTRHAPYTQPAFSKNLAQYARAGPSSSNPSANMTWSRRAVTGGGTCVTTQRCTAFARGKRRLRRARALSSFFFVVTEAPAKSGSRNTSSSPSSSLNNGARTSVAKAESDEQGVLSFFTFPLSTHTSSNNTRSIEVTGAFPNAGRSTFASSLKPKAQPSFAEAKMIDAYEKVEDSS